MTKRITMIALSLLMLFGLRDADWRAEIFGQYDLHNVGLAYMRMLRTNEWKLVRHYRANELDELYDLKNDPDELKNLHKDARDRDVRDRLQRRLDEWMKTINDPLAGTGNTPPVARPQPSRPNILFAIADDWGYGHAGAYGAGWVVTPAFDRVAREGALFTRAYTPNAKCAPSRAIILTGRNSWQLEEAANHIPFFPAKFKTWVESLGEKGYFTGLTGKGWGPGVADDPKRQSLKRRLRRQMERELRAQGDPRMFGRGHVFDQYPYANAEQRNFYERFMRGEKLKAGWVNESDFEKEPVK